MLCFITPISQVSTLAFAQLYYVCCVGHARLMLCALFGKHGCCHHLVREVVVVCNLFNKNFFCLSLLVFIKVKLSKKANRQSLFIPACFCFQALLLLCQLLLLCLFPALFCICFGLLWHFSLLKKWKGELIVTSFLFICHPFRFCFIFLFLPLCPIFTFICVVLFFCCSHFSF